MERPIGVGDLLLGKYRVERTLGRGGMGFVLAVRHVEQGDLFAIKLLLEHALADAATVERFVREARAAARLRSDHVARVVDVGHLETGAPYMVMEHLDGSDLSDVLRARGPLPAEDAIAYVLQACEAIAEAHGAGIIHRDIKPGNLFLTRRANGAPLVKVLDFGIAKHRDQDEIDITHTGVMLGSPSYMSPEQMRRTKAVDARGDVWSMGVVLYKLLTGLTPFHGESIPEIISSVLEEEPEPPSSIRGDLPPALDAFLTRALQKDPERRFQTIDAFAAALTSLRTEMESGPRSTSRPSFTPMRLSARAPSAASQEVTVVEAARTLPSPVAIEPPAPRRRRTLAWIALAALAAFVVAASTWMIRGWTAAPSGSAFLPPSAGAAADRAAALPSTGTLTAMSTSQPSPEAPSTIPTPGIAPSALPESPPGERLSANEPASSLTVSPTTPLLAPPASAGTNAPRTTPAVSAGKPASPLPSSAPSRAAPRRTPRTSPAAR